MNTTAVDVEEPLWTSQHAAPMLMALFFYAGLSIYGTLTGDFKRWSLFQDTPTFATGVAAILVIYTLHFVLTALTPAQTLLPVAVRKVMTAYAWFAPALLATYLAGLTSLAGEGDSLWKIVFACVTVCTFGPMVIALLGGGLLMVLRCLIWPVWHMMGRPSHYLFSPKVVAATTVAPVAAQVVVPMATATPAPKPVPAVETIPVEHPTPVVEPAYRFEWKTPKTNFASMAGMEGLKRELSQAIAPFRGYAQFGPVSDRNGILLSGPPGNGKTSFAQAIAGELGLPFTKVSGVDVTSKWINESPAMLKALFDQAAARPCVVFIDEFDSVAKSRETGSSMSEEDRKLVTALLKLIDDCRDQRVVLIAATNYPDNLDAAVIRDGRFDYRIEVPYPDAPARKAILADMARKYRLRTDEATIAHVTALWERRSIAFIESTVKRLRDTRGADLVTIENFKQASRDASRRAGLIPTGGKKLSELALPAKVRLEAESLVYRMRNWETLAAQGGEPPSGILLYGPPGTGKTLLVRALARELQCWHVLEVNTPEVLQNPRKFTELVHMAADHRPAIVFIDEADELLRDRIASSTAVATNEILKCMDGMMGKVPEVVFIAATNNADAMDAAALRGGRFAEKIYMGNLSGNDLVRFLESEFASMKNVRFASDLNVRSYANRLGQASPADALAILRKAINYSLSGQFARPVGMREVERAIDAMRSPPANRAVESREKNVDWDV